MKKRVGKSANMYVMFGLLAVLFISLGYLSMQTKEGMKDEDKKEEGEGEEKKKKTGNDSDLGKIVAALAAPKDGDGFRGREGLEMACPGGKTRKFPGGPCV
jgi:hypothetical protein